MQNDSDHVAGGKLESAVAPPLTGSMPSAGEYLAHEMQFGADMVSKYSKVCQELATIKRVAACGTVTSFLALSDDEKRNWFALAIEESERRKKLEQRVEELEAALQGMCSVYGNISWNAGNRRHITEMEWLAADDYLQNARDALAKVESGVNPK